MLPSLVATALFLAAPTQSDAAREAWNAGQRLAAIDRAALELEGAPDDLALRRQLVAWEIQVHRYQSALQRMEPGDPHAGIAHYALAQYEQALELLDPRNPDHCERRIESFEALGRFDEADAAAEEASALLGADDPNVLFWRGRSAARRSEHAAAAQLLHAAVAANPVHQAARFALGRALIRAGKREEGAAVLERHRALVPLVDAYEFARQGLDLDPTHAPNRARVAEIEAELGLLDTAERSFAIAEVSADPSERVPVALRHARFFEEQRRDPKRAVAVLERALTGDPDPRLHVRAGDVLERAGELDAALLHLEAARALRPEDEPIRERIARVAAARDDS